MVEKLEGTVPVGQAWAGAEGQKKEEKRKYLWMAEVSYLQSVYKLWLPGLWLRDDPREWETAVGKPCLSSLCRNTNTQPPPLQTPLGVWVGFFSPVRTVISNLHRVVCT